MKASVPWLRLGGVALVAAVLLTACSKVLAPAKPDPTVVTVRVTAAARINVDARARPTPVVIRTYVLKNTGAFDAADFFSLFDRDQQVLGDALVMRDEIVIQPGMTHTFEAREVEDGKVLAVLAAFRDIDRATWRASAPIVVNRVNEIAIGVEENRVAVSAKLGAAKPSAK